MLISTRASSSQPGVKQRASSHQQQREDDGGEDEWRRRSLSQFIEKGFAASPNRAKPPTNSGVWEMMSGIIYSVSIANGFQAKTSILVHHPYVCLCWILPQQ